MRLALALVPFLLLAGCVSGSLQPRPVMHCFDVGIQVDWHEPGAYLAMEAAAREGRLSLAPARPPSGFALPEAWAPERLDGSSAFAVSWRPDMPTSDLPMVQLVWMGPGPEVQIRFAGAGDRDRDADLLARFLPLVGLDDHPQRPAWEARLLAEGDVSPERAMGGMPMREATFEAVPDLAPVLDALRASGEPPTPLRVGEAWWGSGEWRVHLSPPFRIAYWDGPAGNLTLQVDALDRMHARVPFEDSPVDAFHRFRARTEEAFIAWGLPAPTFADASGGGYRC